MIARVYESDDVTIYHGDAHEWDGPEQIDLVLTNPYGPLPHALHATPQIVHQWTHRKHELQRWIGGAELTLLSEWNRGREAFWGANGIRNTIAASVTLEDLSPEPGGWYPLELPLRLLQVFGRPGMTVFDGFMGRGTVGKAALSLGMKYVGVEQLASHISLALDYLEVPRVAT